MKMSLDSIDQQIREVENRIAVERIAFDDAVSGCTNSLREAVTSPKTLLALLGVGYAIGKVMFKEKAPPDSAPVKKAGMLGLLTGVAGTALSMAGPRLGWGGVAKWAARRYFARHKTPQGIQPTTSLHHPPVAPAPVYPRPRAGV